MPATDQPAVLIVSLSGRALAQSARRAGYLPLVADLFGDLDTLDLAEAYERVPGSLGRGFDPPSLFAALDRLAEGRRVIGALPGTGFEDRPKVLAELAERRTLLGNPSEVVVAMKDPSSFAALCEKASVSHPEIRFELPDTGNWVRKRIGGMGGAHIVGSPSRPVAGSGQYYQRRVNGEAVSVGFLASGGACRVVALTRQWADPASQRPFRYGGAVRPAELLSACVAELEAAVGRLVAQTELRGLNSADFLVRDDGFDVLEINPRPGATLDILDDPQGTLFRLHIDACNGVLPTTMPVWPTEAAAAAILHARADLTVPRDFVWPAWTADRTPHGSVVARGLPLCTVLSEGDDANAAERLVRERADELHARLTPPPRPPRRRGDPPLSADGRRSTFRQRSREGRP